MSGPPPNCAEEQETRRARPALGTIVEIAIAGGPPLAVRERAFTAAFAAINEVERLMSYHRADSELSQVNARAHLAPVRVSGWTFAVIKFAQQLAEESEGGFDATVAPRLTTWGYLPRLTGVERVEATATWRDVELRPKRRVSFRRPLRLDLGGIAKGFAVDRAIDALEQSGIFCALVNAGGDLRAVGSEDWPVDIRHPARPSTSAHRFSLQEGAVATSASYFTRKQWRGRWVCPLVDGVTRKACADSPSVSVHAQTALVADALTKIVVARGREAAPILRRYKASAMTIDSAGVIDWFGED